MPKVFISVVLGSLLAGTVSRAESPVATMWIARGIEAAEKGKALQRVLKEAAPNSKEGKRLNFQLMLESAFMGVAALPGLRTLEGKNRYMHIMMNAGKAGTLDLVYCYKADALTVNDAGSIKVNSLPKGWSVLVPKDMPSPVVIIVMPDDDIVIPFDLGDPFDTQVMLQKR